MTKEISKEELGNKPPFPPVHIYDVSTESNSAYLDIVHIEKTMVDYDESDGTVNLTVVGKNGTVYDDSSAGIRTLSFNENMSEEYGDTKDKKWYYSGFFFPERVIEISDWLTRLGYDNFIESDHKGGGLVSYHIFIKASCLKENEQ